MRESRKEIRNNFTRRKEDAERSVDFSSALATLLSHLSVEDGVSYYVQKKPNAHQYNIKAATQPATLPNQRRKEAPAAHRRIVEGTALLGYFCPAGRMHETDPKTGTPIKVDYTITCTEREDEWGLPVLRVDHYFIDGLDFIEGMYKKGS